MTNSPAASTSSDREIVITRVFDASPETVFEAWTDPKHLVHWFGPKGFTTTILQMDVTPGGEWRQIMHGPDGRDYRNRFRFLEVAQPLRLVYQHDPETDSEPVHFETTVTFTPREGKTLLTLTMVFPTAADRDRNVRDYGSIEGGVQTLARLADYLPQILPSREIVITRVFDAPRQLVFRAWTEPGHLARWWGPKDFTNPVCQCDARAGGRWYIVMRAFYGVDYPCGGEYREVVPNERLAFTNDAFDDAGGRVLEGFTTVTFADFEGGKTLLTLTTRASAMIPGMEQALAGMHPGWSQSFDRLAAEVSG